MPLLKTPASELFYKAATKQLDTLNVEFSDEYAVGEVMAIGRTFKESMQKALCSLETDLSGFDEMEGDMEFIQHEIRRPNAERMLYVAEGISRGMSVEEVFDTCKIDPWFLYQIEEIIASEKEINLELLNDEKAFRRLKTDGFSDKRIAKLITQNCSTGMSENDVYAARKRLDIHLEYNEVDTCAAEFEALTPYLYSTTNITNLPKAAPRVTDKKKVLILGGGPNRIGQGIEFDYCCVHAAFALKDMGLDTSMYHCHPETGSTAYDTSHVLYSGPREFDLGRGVTAAQLQGGL